MALRESGVVLAVKCMATEQIPRSPLGKLRSPREG